MWTSTESEIAREALERIGALYNIEREITGRPLEERQAARQAPSRSKVDDFKTWTEAQLRRVSGKSDLDASAYHLVAALRV